MVNNMILISVNLGQERTLERKGRVERTGIFKFPTKEAIRVTKLGLEGDVIVMSDIFAFEQQGIENGKIIGRLKPTGIRPKFYERIEAAGIHLPPNVFGANLRY